MFLLILLLFLFLPLSASDNVWKDLQGGCSVHLLDTLNPKNVLVCDNSYILSGPGYRYKGSIVDGVGPVCSLTVRNYSGYATVSSPEGAWTEHHCMSLPANWYLDIRRRAHEVIWSGSISADLAKGEYNATPVIKFPHGAFSLSVGKVAALFAVKQSIASGGERKECRVVITATGEVFKLQSEIYDQVEELYAKQNSITNDPS